MKNISKKLLVLFVSAFFLVSNTFAQDVENQKKKMTFEYEVFTGLSLAKMVNYEYYTNKYNENYEQDVRPAMILGFNMTYYYYKNLGIKSGLSIIPKGGQYSKENDVVVANSSGLSHGRDVERLAFGYIDIPLLVTFKTKGEYYFTFDAGLSFSLLANSAYKSNSYNNTSGNTSGMVSVEEKWHTQPISDIKTVAVNMIYGVNWNIKLEKVKTKLLLGLAYSKGLTEVFKEDNTGTLNASGTSNAILIKLGVSF